jgi:glutathione S-transferase
MILIGQYDSPFVRRVAIALRLYGLEYNHRPWSVWADAERIAPFNPLRRVPVLVVDGVSLVESAAILDSIDDLVDAERALLPRSGPARRDGLRLCALAMGLGDKAVSLLYERLLRNEERRSAVWVSRCQAQIHDTLALLESERGQRPGTYWLGDRISHADIAMACMLRFLGESHPTLLRAGDFPALTADAARCEAMPEFREISQPLEVKVPASG